MDKEFDDLVRTRCLVRTRVRLSSYVTQAFSLSLFASLFLSLFLSLSRSLCLSVSLSLSLSLALSPAPPYRVYVADRKAVCMLAANTGLTHYYLDYDSAEYDSDVYEPEDLGSCGQSVDTAPHMHDGE